MQPRDLEGRTIGISDAVRSMDSIQRAINGFSVVLDLYSGSPSFRQTGEIIKSIHKADG